MKKYILFLLFISAFAGCQTLKNSMNSVESMKISKRNSVNYPGKLEYKGGTEINKEDYKDVKSVHYTEHEDNEFIFPQKTGKKDIQVIEHEYKGDLIDIKLDLKNIDIKKVIHTFLQEIIKENYILSKGVAGRITLKINGKFHREDVLSIFQSVLNLHGFAIVKQGQIYAIDREQNVKKFPGKIFKGGRVMVSGNNIITQIIHLNYIEPNRILPTLRNFLTKGGVVIAHRKSNAVIILDNAANMERLLTIINEYDTPFFSGKGVKFYDVIYLDVRRLAKILENAVKNLGGRTRGRKSDVSFVPLNDLNKISVTTKDPSIFEVIDLWIRNLDKAPKEGERVNTYIYKLQHTSAEQVAPLLNELYKEVKSGRRRRNKRLASYKKRLIIVPDTETHSLIIKATETDYYQIKQIIAELDATPQEVLIEVNVAEVKLNYNMRYGIQYFIRDRFGIGEDGTENLDNPQRELGVNLGPPAESALLFTNESIGFDLLFSAIAGESTFEFLSTPNILVRDGQTATIQVGTDQPIVSGSTVVGETVTENVQYRAVGIIITVTPHIGENGMVTLDITQEDSEVAGAGVNQNPVFTTRQVETSLIVKDGKTIIIGGIIESRDTLNVKKVPLLGDIPVMGNLFKSKEQLKDNTELLILITPHILDNPHEADIMVKKFEEKLDNIKMLKMLDRNGYFLYPKNDQ